jgi:hypothetical protein
MIHGLLIFTFFNMTAPHELEQQLAQNLLQAALRAQWSVATVKSRELSGAGFFTNFLIPAQAPNLGLCVNFEIGDVNGEVSGVACGFLLFARDGSIDFLEGHVWGAERFPTNPVIDRLNFVRHKDVNDPMLVESPTRDFEARARKLPR